MMGAGKLTVIEMKVHWVPTATANHNVSFGCLEAGVRNQRSLIIITFAVEKVATRTISRHFIDTDAQYARRPSKRNRRI